jgi:hypothetical protein
MKTFLAFALGAAMVAQGVAGPNVTPSAKQAVEEFVKIETDGTRLTPQGWNDANKFFLHPEAFSENITISVVSNEIDVSQKPAADREATCVVFIHDVYGVIDPDLRFTPTPSHASNGAVVLRGATSTYHLELTADTSGQDSNPTPGDWKIKDFQRTVMLNVPTAIRYLTEEREKAVAPAVRRNAEAALAALAKLRP